MPESMRMHVIWVKQDGKWILLPTGSGSPYGPTLLYETKNMAEREARYRIDLGDYEDATVVPVEIPIPKDKP